MFNARWVETNLVHFKAVAIVGGVVYWNLETLSIPKMFLVCSHYMTECNVGRSVLREI